MGEQRNLTEGFKTYYRKGFVEARPYIPGEDLIGISVSEVDDPITDRGWIARNPQKHLDKWYISREYFRENYKDG